MSGLVHFSNEVVATFENVLFNRYGQHHLFSLHYVIVKQHSMVDVVAVDIVSSVEAVVHVDGHTRTTI